MGQARLIAVTSIFVSGVILVLGVVAMARYQMAQKPAEDPSLPHQGLALYVFSQPIALGNF